MSEKYFQSRKLQMHMSRKFFRLSRDWIYLLQNSFSSYVYSRIYTKLWTELEKSICMGVNNFVKSVILLSLHKEKNWNYQSLNTAPYVGEPEWERGEQKGHPSHKSWTRSTLVMKLCMSVMLHKIFQIMPNS